MPSKVYITDEVKLDCVQAVLSCAQERGVSYQTIVDDPAALRYVAGLVLKKRPDVPRALLIKYLKRRMSKTMPTSQHDLSAPTGPRQVVRRSSVERSDDPVWNARAKDLLIYLARRRNWKDMASWARRKGWDESLLRNVIAYADKFILHEDGYWLSLVSERVKEFADSSCAACAP